MKKIKKLLGEVGIINRKNAEILDATGARFNMFKVCGVNQDENKHSSILAEFLNPKGSHGLKYQFLQTFLEVFGIKREFFNAEKAKVIREKYAPIFFKENTDALQKGFIDIFIEDDEKNVIIIENKIRHGDEPEQLKRYDNFAKSYAKNYHIFYLTLSGNEASEQSGGDVDYTPISHEKNIIEWLEKCLSLTTRYPIVRETIVQYINHLKTLTNQNMDIKNQQEVTKILVKDLEAAKAIYQNYQATFDALAKEHFNPKMEEFAKEKGLEYHYEQSWETVIKFYLTSPKWEGKYWIGFNYEGNKYYYGLCNDPNFYKISAEKRAEIHQNLQKLGVLDFKESDWWAFYKYIPTLTIENWQEDIINSDKFFQDCKTKIEEILEAIKDVDL